MPNFRPLGDRQTSPQFGPLGNQGLAQFLTFRPVVFLQTLVQTLLRSLGNSTYRTAGELCAVFISFSSSSNKPSAAQES
jgi:hypothetical protein